MKRPIKHILILSLLLILPISHSVVYGQVKIQRNGYDLKAGISSGVARTVTFNTVAAAAEYTGPTNGNNYVNGTEQTTKGIQNGDVIVLTDNTTETKVIQPAATITIQSSDEKSKTITASPNGNFKATINDSENTTALLCICWNRKVTISNNIILDANTSNITNNNQKTSMTVAHVSHSGELILNGTLKNGNTTSVDNMGGGITLVGSGTATINDGGSIESCSAINGGGIYVDNTLSMTGGSVSGNSATSKGGGIYVPDGAKITLTSTAENSPKIQYNQANNGYGGGIYIQSSNGQCSLNGSITNNKAMYGGGICLESCYKTTFGTVNITDNEASKDGGGIYAKSNSTVTLNKNNTITQNICYRDGGGIYANNIHLKIDKATISNNRCYADNYDVHGGGIYLTGSSSDLNLTDVEISNNYLTLSSGSETSKTLYGAGICIDNSKADDTKISNCIIKNNICGGDDESSITGKNLYGGGIYVKKTTLTISGGELSSNKAYKAGAIAVCGNAKLIAKGQDASSPILIRNHKSTSNGGAIWANNDDTNYPTIELQFIKFMGNKSTGSGGALDIYALDNTSSSIKDCTFEDNESQYDGGAINIEGGLESQLSLPISGSTFINNKAGSNEDGSSSSPERGSAICISQPNNSTNFPHTVVLSGTNSFDQDQSVRLRYNAALTKGENMTFGEGKKLDVYPEDLSDGRDILVSGSSESEAAALRGLNAGNTVNEGGAEVTDGDLQKLNVVAPHYHTVHNTTDKVIELLKNYLLTISCTGLQANESAAYRVKDGLNGGGNTLYNVILTGDGTSDPVSKTIEIDYESPKAKSVTSTWEWTYDHAETTPSNTQEVTFDNETKVATCSFTVTKNPDKLYPHGEHSITLGNTTTNE